MQEVVEIVVITYFWCECAKALIEDDKIRGKVIPVLSMTVGMVIAVIWYTFGDSISWAGSLPTAMAVGISSGATATGAHQALKNLIFKKE